MPTGNDIVAIARQHLGEKYIFGTPVPKDDPAWKGPWDCAEFVSWCVYQVSQKLYGCLDNSGAPAHAEAYTGYWGRDADQLGAVITLSLAAVIPGALVLRNPGTACGHIVISDGAGGTIEAHSMSRGIITDRLDQRRWDIGILVPWIKYTPLRHVTAVVPPGPVYRVTTPLMDGAVILAIQQALVKQRLDPGALDGRYGTRTAAAITVFQCAGGLVVDGEVGAQTARLLGVALEKV